MNQLDKIRKKNPFKVPEGYFEGLSDQIMTQLPQKVEIESYVPTLWERVKPWTYMAAMFVGIALMIKMFVGTPSEPLSSGITLTSGAEMEEFYQYYEDELTKNMYHESIYLDGFEEDELIINNQ